MPYHLDTNICAAAMKGITSVQDRMRAHASEVSVSAIVLGELHCGALRSQRVERNLETLSEFIAGVGVVPFDVEAARVSGIWGYLC